MGAASDRMKKMVKYLADYGAGDATAALDGAVRACSEFSGVDDLIKCIEMERAYYTVHGLTQDYFLQNTCGIILDNEDTGAITGSDADGGAVKTATSVVPEDNTTPAAPSATSSTVSSNGGNVTVVWPSTTSSSWRSQYWGDNSTVRSSVLASLNTWWLPQSLNLIYDSYGIGFGTAKKAQTLNIKFYRDYDDILAYVVTASGGTERSLNMNETYTDSLEDFTDGKVSDTDFYYDRVLAHELTHAVMAANIETFVNLPIWFKEGAAELVHGVDDERRNTIRNVTSDAESLIAALDQTSTTSVYAAGYIALRFLAHRGTSYLKGTNFVENASLHYDGMGTKIIVESGGEKDIWLDGSQGTIYSAYANEIDASTSTKSVKLFGNAADNLIKSGSGGDMLWGGWGNDHDTLVGGNGADQFFYCSTDGEDTVLNSGTEDMLLFFGANDTDFKAINFDGANLTFELVGGKVTVNNWQGDAGMNNFMLANGQHFSVQNINGGYYGAPRNDYFAGVKV